MDRQKQLWNKKAAELKARHSFGKFFGKFNSSTQFGAGEEGFEPSHAGIKIRCLNQLGDSPTILQSNSATDVQLNQYKPALTETVDAMCYLF